MNIFEGARRIAKVMTAIAIVFALCICFTTHPYFNKYYSLSNDGIVKEVDGCSGDPSFLSHVKNTPEWSTISICGYEKGPQEVEFSDEDLKHLNYEISSKVANNLGQTIGVTAGCVAIGWFLVWCIGWVVRGFLGIPRGQDYRISSVEK